VCLMTHQRLHLYVPDDTLALLDAQRGPTPRSAYIRWLIEGGHPHPDPVVPPTEPEPPIPTPIQPPAPPPQPVETQHRHYFDSVLSSAVCAGCGKTRDEVGQSFGARR
jgi:hypothetical protein